MCERTEREAVAVLHSSMIAWMGQGGSMHDYDDDIALTILVKNGIRPSGLSADLDWLIARAQREVLRGGLCE